MMKIDISTEQVDFIHYGKDYKDDYNQTPLHWAAESNNISWLKQLIRQGAYVNARDNEKQTPLHLAAEKNRDESHYEVCETLLKNGANVNIVNFLGKTPLYYLVEHGNLRIVEELFIKNFKANVKCISKFGRNLLFSDALYWKNSEKNSMEIVKLFVGLGLDVNRRDQMGLSPLSIACCSAFKSTKKLKFLMQNGANVHTLDKFGHIPLNKAFDCIYRWNGIPLEIIKKNITFIMEHTDFNLASKVFETFSKNEKPEEEPARKTLLEFLAKLQYLDISMHSDVLSTIFSNNYYKTYYIKCQVELMRTKSVKLKNSWVTLQNLLVDGRKKLKNYAGNQDLIEDFKNRDGWILQCFPIYGASIKENLNKAIERRKLFDKSSEVLSHLLPIFNPTHLIVKDIFDCILSKKDLSKLCN